MCVCVPGTSSRPPATPRAAPRSGATVRPGCRAHCRPRPRTREEQARTAATLYRMRVRAGGGSGHTAQRHERQDAPCSVHEMRQKAVRMHDTNGVWQTENTNGSGERGGKGVGAGRRRCLQRCGGEPGTARCAACVVCLPPALHAASVAASRRCPGPAHTCAGNASRRHAARGGGCGGGAIDRPVRAQ